MAATKTTHSNALNEIFRPQYTEAVYYNSDLLKWFPRPVPHTPGGQYVNWIVHTAAAGTVQVFTEGQALPLEGNETTIQAYISPVYIRDVVRISNILRDAVGNAGHYNVFDMEIQQKINAIKDLFETSFMESTYGLELAIDSSSNYAGVTRSSATYWQSTETAVSGTLSWTNIRDLIETCRDNDKGGLKQPHWFMPWNQYSNLFSIAGQPGYKSFPSTDALQGYSAQQIDGAPVTPLGDMTNTVILAVDMAPGNWYMEEFRPLTIKSLSEAGDDDRYSMSAGLALACFNPKNHGKLTGVTA